MDLTYTQTEMDFSLEGVESVEQSEGSLLVTRGDTTDEIKNSTLTSVRSAHQVSVRGYYGEEVSQIDQSDIITFLSDVLCVECSSAQQIGNRVIVQFENYEVEFSGDLESASS